jgi:phage shock protein PspC (stress-responsive transcriptional regulator)
VAAGIGRRYGIDPIIVRIALVVSALYGGSGVLCYLLGWLFFAVRRSHDHHVTADQAPRIPFGAEGIQPSPGGWAP